MDTKVHMDDLHQENRTWINNLDFYKDELETFNKRLGEVINQNNTIEVTSMVEHFQNQFIRQKEVLDELKHDVKTEENDLVQNVKDYPVASDRRLFPDHKDLRDKLKTFDKIYLELKCEFENFLSKTL